MKNNETKKDSRITAIPYMERMISGGIDSYHTIGSYDDECVFVLNVSNIETSFKTNSGIDISILSVEDCDDIPPSINSIFLCTEKATQLRDFLTRAIEENNKIER